MNTGFFSSTLVFVLFFSFPFCFAHECEPYEQNYFSCYLITYLLDKTGFVMGYYGEMRGRNQNKFFITWIVNRCSFVASKVCVPLLLPFQVKARKRENHGTPLW